MSGRGRAPSEQTAPPGLTPDGNGLGRESVAEIQRARLLTAMVEVTAERGAGNVTVAHVVARSGVSRRTFYEQFEDREDCFLAAFEDGIARLAAAILPAYERGARRTHGTDGAQSTHGWRERIRAGLVALLSVLESDPALARLVVVESLAAGPKAIERRARVAGRLVAAVDEGRGEGKGGSVLAPLTAEGVVGGVLAVLHERLEESRRGRAEPPRVAELTNPLMSMIVLPYLGPAAARKELERSVPEVSGNSRRIAPHPLRDLGMRLTYRTVRVLMAVGAHPGSSNRVVADGAGISDQGQVSKLLARLQGLGLIQNTGVGPARGEPNAWTLTEKGWEVQSAIAHQTS
jgi:AcrR family transcriptional regulator